MTRIACTAATIVLITGLGRAQDPPSQAPAETDDQRITVDVDLVNVLFTAMDEDGRYLTDLTADDFTVYEDDVPQEITLFEAETDRPLVIGLVIDISASVRDKLEFEQEAASEFFYSILERDRDEAMLVAFDTEPRLLQDFTDDPERLSVAVEKLEAGGTSALYDAVWLAIDAKMAGERQEEARRILIVISDGADTASRKSLDETLEIAQRNDVSIYAISTNGTANFGNAAQELGDRALEELAGETGGRAFFPLRIEELRVTFAEIGDELRLQYAVGYYPTNDARDGTYREIRIEPRDGDYRVQARSGYYAPAAGPE